MQLWSPDSPFLYELIATVYDGDAGRDRTVTRFGMREFSVRGGDFYLNGKKQYLRGSNIAFHRFLSDPQRGALPWDEEWIKRVLIDIPKEHNFNFFRNHLGQMYNRWYDIADEYGMLLQNEWQFWGVTGTKEQITREFTRWLEDNRNHPSIVIWDALNESQP
jgi:beta-galactosidase